MGGCTPIVFEANASDYRWYLQQEHLVHVANVKGDVKNAPMFSEPAAMRRHASLTRDLRQAAQKLARPHVMYATGEVTGVADAITVALKRIARRVPAAFDQDQKDLFTGHVRDYRGRLQTINPDDEDAPVMVVGEDGELEQYQESDYEKDEDENRKNAPVAEVSELTEPMARTPGTCHTKKKDDDEEWIEWCDKNCIPTNFGGLGKTACHKGTDTGAVGCVCKTFHGQPITQTEYDIQWTKIKEKKRKEKAAHDEEVRRKKDARDAKEAAKAEQEARKAAEAVTYSPADAETCKGRDANTPDYWCVEICKASCPRDACVCDGESANA